MVTMVINCPNRRSHLLSHAAHAPVQTHITKYGRTLITQFLWYTHNSPVGFCHRTHCTCPGLISGLCRLDFECSPSTPETPAYTDTQDGLAGMVGL